LGNFLGDFSWSLGDFSQKNILVALWSKEEEDARQVTLKFILGRQTCQLARHQADKLVGLLTSVFV
jgi:hypothetical protein